MRHANIHLRKWDDAMTPLDPSDLDAILTRTVSLEESIRRTAAWHHENQTEPPLQAEAQLHAHA